ncbi:hypothetical protein BH23ACT10_BH23ACT10_25380 [soil metagenome]
MSRCASVVIAATSALLGACATAAPVTPAEAVAPATEVRVGLTEWDIVTDGSELAAGPVELTITNVGSTAHDLRAAIDGGTTAATPLLQRGERQQLTFDAPAGATVELWCTVPGHDAQGMHTTLAVD